MHSYISCVNDMFCLIADRLWWFQVCTEVAYFQVAPKNGTVRSPNIDTRYSFIK